MYFGENMIIVATGSVSHDQIVDLAENHFGRVPKTNGGQKILNLDTPKFNPGFMYVHDQKMQS